MPKIIVKDNESLDEAIKRFKRQVNKAAILQEAKKRAYFVPKSLKRQLKSELARRKK